MDQRAVVSLFVDHAYTTDQIKLFMGMAPGFNVHVGDSWHMLIPYRDGGYVVDVPLDPAHYGVGLARHIINENELKHADLPAIIFEFVPKEHYCVKFGGRSKEDVVRIIGTIADIAKQAAAEGPADVESFRLYVHQRVIRYLMGEKALHIAGKVAPNLLAAAGLV